VLICLALSSCSSSAVIAIVDAGTEADGGAEVDAGALVDASSTDDANMPPADGGAQCGRTLSIEICNPITNMGCTQGLGMQCDVNLLASTLQGQCVFSAPAVDGGTCLNIPPTETCPPRHTCVDFNECRKVCLCDTDCDPGDCCSVPLGEQGFKTCRPCAGE
jgi:hypothetical protein